MTSDAPIRATPVPGWYGSFSEPGVQPEDPYPGFRELRETQPVNLTPEGTWRLSRYDDVQRLLRVVPAGVRRTDGLVPGQTEAVPGAGLFMLMQDPPNHTRLRKLVSKAFTPRAIEAWRPRIEAITEACLDRVATKGEMDLIADLALPVPATLICELMGVPPGDHARFTEWTATATHGLVTVRGLGDDALKTRVQAAAMQLQPGWHCHPHFLTTSTGPTALAHFIPIGNDLVGYSQAKVITCTPQLGWGLEIHMLAERKSTLA